LISLSLWFYLKMVAFSQTLGLYRTIGLACLLVGATTFWWWSTRKDKKSHAIVDGFYKWNRAHLKLVELNPGRRLCVFRKVQKSNSIILVFIHGACAWMGQYRNQIRYFSNSSSIGVVSMDLLGCGQSDKPVGVDLYTNEKHLADCGALLQTLPQDIPVVLVGHSYGTSLVMELTNSRKKLIQGLILLSPNDLCLSSLQTPLKIFSLPIWLLALIRPILSRGFRSKGYHPSTPARFSAVGHAATSRHPMHMISSFYSTFDGWSDERISPLFEWFDKKVLVLAGVGDKIIPPEKSYKLSSRFKKSEFVRVERAAHQLMVEQPDVVIHNIKRYLEEL